MPEPDEEVPDAKAYVVVPRRLTASRLAALCVAGLLGGVVGAVGLGLVVPQIGRLFIRGEMEGFGEAWGWGLFILGAVLGLPIGTATGLHIAGTNLGIRGRFWPTVGASFAGILASVCLSLFLNPLMHQARMDRAVDRYLPFLSFAAYFVPPLVGGLAGYLLSRPKRPDDAAGDP